MYNRKIEKFKKKIRKLNYYDKLILMDWLVDWYEWEKWNASQYKEEEE